MKQGRKQLKKRFVDTNIFIHSLFPVDKNKYSRCNHLFNKATEGKILLWTSEWVIAELVWFLQRKKTQVEACKEIIIKILSTKGLEVKNKQWLLNILDLWDERMDFVDVIGVLESQKEGIQEGYSYDRQIDKFAGFTRLEP